MAIEKILPASHIQGQPLIPGDKSISHRSLLFGAISQGTTTVDHLLESEDVLSTMRCLRQLGVSIEQRGTRYVVQGLGGFHFQTSSAPLDCGNSGTTMRLLMGLLAGQNISSTLVGDDSLSRRPMKRVSESLASMGAKVELTNGNFPPVTIHGASLSAIDYSLAIASAQIKSAIIFAALQASGTTTIRGEIHSRDHTERMLQHFGGKISVEKDRLSVSGGQVLVAKDVQVPGDPSTAAFWMAAASMLPGSRVTLENISLNPTRLGFVDVLRRMGAKIDIVPVTREPEPIGSITVTGGVLRGVHVTKDMIPSMVDEVPMLAVLATQAQGETVIEGAEELRVKESDRIEAVAMNLRAMGADVDVRPDGFRILGPQPLKGASISTFHDHRIAMAFSVAGLLAKGETEIQHSECVAISYPNFFRTLAELRR